MVERRQQIGVLRAIGYRRGMVQLSFLLESSFVALLGAIIGVVLGIVLGWNAVADIRDDEGVDTIRFSVPWVQIVVILVATYVFSLLAHLLPRPPGLPDPTPPRRCATSNGPFISRRK